jgi:hypothetical protein
VAARQLGGERQNSTVPVALGWMIALSSHYGPMDPRPILMEVKVASRGQKTVVIDANQRCVLHGSYGPWDGTVLCVATKDNGPLEQGSHTEPLWWQGRAQPLSNHVRVPDH